MSCCVCNSVETPHEVLLSREEILSCEKVGITEKTLLYCNSCWKVLHDKVHGQNFMVGLAQVSLKHAEDRVVDQYVTKLRDILQKTKK